MKENSAPCHASASVEQPPELSSRHCSTAFDRDRASTPLGVRGAHEGDTEIWPRRTSARSWDQDPLRPPFTVCNLRGSPLSGRAEPSTSGGRLGPGHTEPEQFVFGRGAMALSSTELHRAWKRVVAAAKVRYRSPEQLRHTFASTMLSRNAPLLYVQQQGGWRSASVLLRVYARWMPQDFGGALTEQPSATQAQPGPVAIVSAKGRNAG
jgi:integrase